MRLFNQRLIFLFPHRPVYKSGLAEAAAARAPAQHLDREAIMHAFGVRDDARLPSGAFREASEQAFLDMLGNARLERLDGLTPGDFAAVRRGGRFNPLKNTADFVTRLEGEVEMKEEGRKKPQIGFY